MSEAQKNGNRTLDKLMQRLCGFSLLQLLACCQCSCWLVQGLRNPAGFLHGDSKDSIAFYLCFNEVSCSYASFSTRALFYTSVCFCANKQAQLRQEK